MTNYDRTRGMTNQKKKIKFTRKVIKAKNETKTKTDSMTINFITV